VGADLTTFEPAETPSALPGPSLQFLSRMRLEVLPECYKVHGLDGAGGSGGAKVGDGGGWGSADVWEGRDGYVQNGGVLD